jgi:hypothetical protein
MRLCPFSLCAVFVATLASPGFADIHLVPNAKGALSGRTVVFSPGHGKMIDGSSWRYQRGIVHEIREDIHTNEIFIEYAQRYLANAGARVESVRERSFQTAEVIVDNTDAGYSELGSWAASSTVSGYYGAGYRYAKVEVGGLATATFRPDLPVSGRYPVYVWYAKSSNRSTSARYIVEHSGGRTEQRLDQSELGDHWLFLGDFHFEAGSGGSVTLANDGSDQSRYVIADAVRFGGGVGDSGEPRWKEGAKDFLAYKGFSSSRGEVTVRPAYAVYLAGGDTSVWRDDFIYFMLHTNASGGSGTARGLSSFSYSNGRTPSWGSAGAAHYPTSPSPLADASDRFRDIVHAQIIADVQATVEPSWSNRGINKMNFGELRECRNMPSMLVELGFHDNADDAGLLKDARFRHVAGRAMYKGIVRTFDANAEISPLAPDGLRMENLGGGQVRVSWEPVIDPLEPTAIARSFKVYQSSNGRGFDEGFETLNTSVVLSASTGGLLFVRVAALNDGGESLPSTVGGVRVGGIVDALIVDGFDRLYRHNVSNIEGRYTRDYVVEHLEALRYALPGSGVDFSANEAIISGAIDLRRYVLADWMLGREGSVDRTFDSVEQSLVESFLKGGGALLASGTEIGWDLEARSGGKRFLNDVLGARYVRDDAGVRQVSALKGGPLGVGASLLLDDGTQGRYETASPDVFSALGGATEALQYDGSGGDAAAITQSAPYRVAVLGFPIETVTDAGARQELVDELVSYLVAPGAVASLPLGSGASPSSGGPSGSQAALSAPTGSSGGGGGCEVARDGGGPGSLLPLLAALMLLAARRRAA